MMKPLKIKISADLLTFLIKQLKDISVEIVDEANDYIIENIVLIEWIQKYQFKLLEKIINANYSKKEISLTIDYSVVAAIYNHFNYMELRNRTAIYEIRQIFLIIDKPLKLPLAGKNLILNQ